jgi:DNA-binding beta-propeller fold protein YncE
VTGDAPGLMTLVAGVGDSIGTRVDSLARTTKLTEPRAIAFDDASGVLYLADRGSTVSAGGTTRRVARIFAVESNGRIRLLIDSGACPAPKCPEVVHSMAVAGDASVLLADPVGHRVYRLRPGIGIEVIAGTGIRGDSPDGTAATAAVLNGPAGIAFDGTGRIILSEQLGHRVRAIRADGMLETVAGTGTAGSSGDGGPAGQASLNGPAGLAVSAAGVLYIADRLNARIRAVSLQTGTITTIAGTSPGYGGDGGPAIDGSMDRPESVAVTPDGLSLYIADSGNHRVRLVNLTGGTIQTFAGDGSTVFNGAGRIAGDTSLETPTAVATPSHGFLFITDTGHSAVWRTRVVP